MRKSSLSDVRKSTSKSPAQTVKAISNTDVTPPGRVGTITVKVVSGNQIDLKWAGVKDSDLNHYNVYLGTKSSFKVSPGVTVPTGTSTTNSYSSTGLKPSTKYYYKIAAVDNSGNMGSLSTTKSGRTNAAFTQNDSPPQKVGGLSVTSVSSTQLNLKWSANKENDFSHYNVYKGTKASYTVILGTTPPIGTSSTNTVFKYLASTHRRRITTRLQPLIRQDILGRYLAQNQGKPSLVQVAVEMILHHQHK